MRYGPGQFSDLFIFCYNNKMKVNWSEWSQTKLELAMSIFFDIFLAKKRTQLIIPWKLLPKVGKYFKSNGFFLSLPPSRSNPHWLFRGKSGSLYYLCLWKIGLKMSFEICVPYLISGTRSVTNADSTASPPTLSPFIVCVFETTVEMIL